MIAGIETAGGWGGQVAAVIVAIGALVTALYRGRTANNQAQDTDRKVEDLDVRHERDIHALNMALRLTQENAARDRAQDKVDCEKQLDYLRDEIAVVRKDRAHEIADVVVGRLAPLLSPSGPPSGENPTVR